MSHPGRAVITVRFYVGEDREDSLVKIYNKIDSNTDLVPAAVTGWVVKPLEIDDVPPPVSLPPIAKKNVSISPAVNTPPMIYPMKSRKPKM